MASQGTVLQDVLATLQDKLSRSPKSQSFFDLHAQQTIDFFRAIDWSQHWLIGLLAFHTVCFIVAILLRNNHRAISVYFFILLGFACLTQSLNSLGAKHWEDFASANYFDEAGLFIVSMYAFPLIFNCAVTLVFILAAAARTMIAVKRIQLKRKKQ